MPITPAWPTVWRELRERLAEQPHCPLHPEHPCVRTLAQGIINDLLDIDEGGLRVRSHRTDHEDIIDAHRFETWWRHLVAHGSASLHPGDSNNLHPWRSRIVGAILAAGLPDRVTAVGTDTIKLIR